MAVDFKSLLSIPLDEVKAPQALPAGTYFGVIKDVTQEVSKTKQTPGLKVFMQLVGPGDDIDPDQLDGVDLTKKVMSTTFWLSPDSMFRIKNLLESCGVETTGRTLGAAVADLKGQSVQLVVQQRSSEDGQQVYNDVGAVAGLS